MIATYYFEFLALCAALYSITKLKNSHMIWFIPFLIFTILLEVGSDFIYNKYQLKTDWIYNILIPTTNIFYGYIFYYLIRDIKLKKLFLISGLLYLLFNIYFLTVKTGFNVLIVLSSSIILVILSCYYFYRCLLDDVDLNVFYVKSGLWFAAGILIFL